MNAHVRYKCKFARVRGRRSCQLQSPPSQSQCFHGRPAGRPAGQASERAGGRVRACQPACLPACSGCAEPGGVARSPTGLLVRAGDCDAHHNHRRRHGITVARRAEESREWRCETTAAAQQQQQPPPRRPVVLLGAPLAPHSRGSLAGARATAERLRNQRRRLHGHIIWRRALVDKQASQPASQVAAGRPAGLVEPAQALSGPAESGDCARVKVKVLAELKTTFGPTKACEPAVWLAGWLTGWLANGRTHERERERLLRHTPVVLHAQAAHNGRAPPACSWK